MEAFTSKDKLKEALSIAEKTLEELKDEESYKIRRKRDRITKAVEKAYGILNLNKFTEKELEKCTNDIWVSMMDDDHHIALFVFFFSFLLAGATIFALYQAYNFFQTINPSQKGETNIPEGDISTRMDISYKDNNVVSLFDLIPVLDEVGIENTPREFTIKNDSKKIADAEYVVNYTVNLVPMNDLNAKLLEKKNIKYKYVYTNSWTGKTYESKIGSFDDLPINSDGTFTLMSGTQLKDTHTDFKVTFWLSSDATESQSDCTYTFAFKINSTIERL